ncbi:MAG: 50S ribosomal protein L25/general stress protein Ctc [Micrococcaceae bacterium]
MAEKIKLDGADRTNFGKGASRQLRRDNQIPAVIYGKTDPVHVAVPFRELSRALRNSNALINLTVGDKKYLVLTRDVQRNVVTREIEHVDLLEVRKGDKRVVDVPIHVTGEAAPGSVTSLEHGTIALTADVTNIPEFLTVDVEGREIGDHAHAGDIELPEGSVLYGDEDQLVVHISEKRDIEEELEAELEEGAEGEDTEGEEGEEGTEDSEEGSSDE